MDHSDHAIERGLAHLRQPDHGQFAVGAESPETPYGFTERTSGYVFPRLTFPAQADNCLPTGRAMSAKTAAMVIPIENGLLRLRPLGLRRLDVPCRGKGPWQKR